MSHLKLHSSFSLMKCHMLDLTRSDQLAVTERVAELSKCDANFAYALIPQQRREGV